jgi:hypothetical protein
MDQYSLKDDMRGIHPIGKHHQPAPAHAELAPLKDPPHMQKLAHNGTPKAQVG